MEYFTKDYVRRLEDRESRSEIKPFFLDFHKMTVADSYNYPKHTHNQYEVIWVEKGPYRCILNEQEISLDNGRILVIKPGDSHQDLLRRGQEHFVLHFRLEEDFFAESLTPKDQIAPQKMDNAGWIFPEIKKATPEKTEDNHFISALQDAWLAVMFWNIVRLYPLSQMSESFRRYSKKEIFHQKLYDQFSKYYRQRTTVDQIAENMGTTKRTLTDKCHKYLNQSPGKLFLQYRIDKAKYLLDSGSMNIKEISYYLGFDTPYNFSRAFKRLSGISPSVYSSASTGS